MKKYKVIIWYIGVLLVSLSLLLSFITKNWILAIVCAIVTVALKSKNNEIEIPRIYREKGVSNTFFTNGGQHEKNNK